jgi:Porin subfamily
MEIQMKLKSLLLGTAAALFALSGARAADAVIAEPEPVEYVRVCDAYGAGFFYIPGTETCLKISGYVRYDIDFNEDGWAKNARGMVNFDARSDTELGLLRSFIAFQGNTAPNTATDTIDLNGGLAGGTTTVTIVDNRNLVIIDEAFIQLGGLTVGLTYDYFDAYDIGGENDDLGSARVNLVGYTYAANGFNVGIALVDDGDRFVDFTPDVQGTVGFTAGPAAVQFVAAYDNNTEEYAAKAVVTADVTEGGTLGAAVVYASGATYTWDLSEWSVAASYTQKFSDTIKASIGAQYFGDVDFVSNADAYSIGFNVDWTPVKNFLVRGQIQYVDSDLNTDGEFNGKVRFQRSF